jgi:hypothetical protein
VALLSLIALPAIAGSACWLASGQQWQLGQPLALAADRPRRPDSHCPDLCRLAVAAGQTGLSRPAQRLFMLLTLLVCVLLVLEASFWFALLFSH